ncbi:MAG TPA: FmdB family zinc ribbon protein [Terracidiphilus sp.]|nr:FmdB family zinc ribbon protein [Terracidiphilus sp.]
MPLYEYRCTQCGHRFEKIQSFSAAPDTDCPQCHGLLERPLSAPALQFKGAGWYVNDYSSKAASKAASDSSANGASESAPSTADAKPAASASAQPSASESAKPAAAETAAKPATPSASGS